MPEIVFWGRPTLIYNIPLKQEGRGQGTTFKSMTSPSVQFSSVQSVVSDTL